MHNRSVSENVIYSKDGEPFSGPVETDKGKLKTSGVSISGDSLLLGADLQVKRSLEVFLVNSDNI